MLLGVNVGPVVGATLGTNVGNEDGLPVGRSVGEFEGTCVGCRVGDNDGNAVGDPVGACVGFGVHNSGHMPGQEMSPRAPEQVSEGGNKKHWGISTSPLQVAHVLHFPGHCERPSPMVGSQETAVSLLLHSGGSAIPPQP
jgi:hypothetical protein